MKRCTLLLCFSMLIFSGFAQLQSGEISGKVLYEGNQKPAINVRVNIEQEGWKKKSCLTDSFGIYRFTNLLPGLYRLVIEKSLFVGYISREVMVSAVEPALVNLVVDSITLGPKVIVRGILKVRDTAATPGSLVIPGHILAKLPEAIAAVSFDAASVTIGGATYLSGTRTNATQTTLNGSFMRREGIINLDLQSAEVNSAGLPASMGDLLGGQMSFTTTMPASRHSGQLQLVSSSLTDPYHYNHIEGTLRGPLLWKNHSKDSGMLLGYTFAGNYIYRKDANPSNGQWLLKSEKLNELEDHPMVLAPNGQTMINKAETFNSNDLYWSKIRPNTESQNYALKGKILYHPIDNVIVTAEGNYNRQSMQDGGFGQSIFNPDMRLRTTNGEGSFILNFNHVLKSYNRDDTSSIVMSLNYTIRMNYLHRNSLTEDELLKDNFFEYGYLGKYVTRRQETYRTINTGLGPSTRFETISPFTGKDTIVYLRHYVEMQGLQDTSLEFYAAEINAQRSRFTQDVMNQFDLRNLTELQSRSGLRNGEDPVAVYNMWGNIGSSAGTYRKSQVDLYNFYAVADAQVRGNKRSKSIHQLQFGMQYEQRVIRGYSLNANGLWGLMRQYADLSKPVLDRSNAIISWDEDGFVNDTVKYNYVVNDDPSSFIYNLRRELIRQGRTDVNGRLYDENSYIDIDELNPSDFRLSMLSPDELLNGGKSSLISYYGYDYTGNKLRGKSSINDFINKPSREVGAFRPVYWALFIQDKFNFRDLDLRLGVRVDRYDANQAILNDPYSLYPIRTVREVRQESGLLSSQINNSITDDAYVYVNDVEDPTKVTGYRTMGRNNQARWYDKNGVELNDPGTLARSTDNGQIAPYLVNKGVKKLSAASFKDYVPGLFVMPRVWIRLPIDVRGSYFFANYDKYTQRPQEGNFASIDDYYFLPQRSDRVLNNPALRPTRKTDYTIGFKNFLTRNSVLGVSAFYSEIRDLIQVTRYNYAYPVSYTSFGNLDFSTVKALRVEYNLKAKNLSFLLNYTLQHADGTGSSSGSGINLVNSGQPNLRTVFPLDYDVRHNIKLNADYSFSDSIKYIFLKDVEFNISLFTSSGLPYTKIKYAVNEAQNTAARTTIEGGVNSNRLPWQVNVNMHVQKSFQLSYHYDTLTNTVRGTRLVTFIQVQNIFNSANPIRVYQYSGSATSDGYLASADGQRLLENSTYAQSFADLYNARIMNPSNFSAPRQIRLGVRFEF